MTELFRFVSLRGAAPIEAETRPFVVEMSASVAATDTQVLNSNLDKIVRQLASVGWRADFAYFSSIHQRVFPPKPGPTKSPLESARLTAEKIVIRTAIKGSEKSVGEADRAIMHILVAEWMARVVDNPSAAATIAVDEQANQAREFFSRAVVVGTKNASQPEPSGEPATIDEPSPDGGGGIIIPVLGDRSLGVTQVALSDARNARTLVNAALVSAHPETFDGFDAQDSGALEQISKVGVKLFGTVSNSWQLEHLERLLEGLDQQIQTYIAELAKMGDVSEGQPVFSAASVAKDLSAGNRNVAIPMHIGVGDLMLTSLRSTSYAYGDIAHVENVLAGETRTRTFNRTESTETDVFASEETETITERESQSTQRFELEKASESSLKESLNINAGASVSGTYGPVSAQASFGINSATSRESSARQSAKFSQEVVSKAVAKVRQFASTQSRTITKVIVSDATVHEMKNAAVDAKHIVGVYRWVDKIKHLHLENYGQRMMLSFTLPEPAAYLRWLKARREQLAISTLQPPTVERNGAKVPLEPTDITPENYLTWVAAYGVSDVSPPPQLFTTNSFTKFVDPTASAENVGLVNFSNDSLTVEPGYRAKTFRGVFVASIDPTKFPAGTTFNLSDAVLFVNNVPMNLQSASRNKIVLSGPGNIQTAFVTSVDFVFTANSTVPASSVGDGAASTKIPVLLKATTMTGYALSVEVVCERTAALLDKWKLETWDKIRKAYLAAATAEQSARERGSLPSVTIDGRNPTENRRAERAELKRFSIEAMIGNFDGIDAMNDANGHRPHVDGTKTLDLDSHVRFFEDMFEWEHMSWNCMDYFWAPEENWDALSTIVDNDPDHRAFLSAGAATVVLPVSPGYEAQFLFFKTSGKTWPGTRAPLPAELNMLSIGAEVITSARGAPQRGVSVPGSEWDEKLPTNLVILQPDGNLGWSPPAS
jgi:hypothetical protein